MFGVSVVLMARMCSFVLVGIIGVKDRSVGGRWRRASRRETRRGGGRGHSSDKRLGAMAS